MRTKFLTTCTACNGTGTYEEPFCTFGNETHYRQIECGCENGKMFNHFKYWGAVDLKKDEIKHYNESVDFRLNQAKKYCNENNESMTYQAIKSMIEAENKVDELEEQLAELENIEG
jgi:hypothetical protein